MPSSRNTLHQPEALASEPGPKRPKTLLQRVSSGLSAIMPQLRRTLSKVDVSGRPETAPDAPRRPMFESIRNRLKTSSHPRPGVPHLNIPQLSDANPVCSYDSSVHSSFPNIETPRCNFCGLRAISRSAPNEPCIECRSRSSFSHLTSAFRRTGVRRRSISAVETRTSEPASNSSSEDGPRIVPDTVAAMRVGNPPRRASLPPDQIPFSHNPSRLLSISQDGGPDRPSGLARDSTLRSRGSQTREARPISPKLHHLHGLPHSREYPYVHKHEVETHLFAIRTGSPSTLLRHIDEVTSSVDPREPYADYSQTVFYGQTFSLNSSRGPSHAATSIAQCTGASGNIVVEESRRGSVPHTVWDELESSRVFRRRTPQPSNQQRGRPSRGHDADSGGSISTLTTQSPPTIGGMRLELKGGSDHLRLRGGIGSHFPAPAGLGFRSTSLHLTCPGTHLSTSHCVDYEHDDLPQPRVLYPKRFARMYESAHGRSHLPAEISRGSEVRTASTAAIKTTKISACPSHELHRTSANHSHIHLPTRPRSYIPPPAPQRVPPSTLICSYTHPQPQTPPRPIPTLRGGARSPSPSDSDRVPAGLYWLAGGRGRPINVASWKTQRPKRRMGGLLGMAIFGNKAGLAYETKDKEDKSGYEDFGDGKSVGSVKAVNGSSRSTSVVANVGSSSESSSSRSSAVQRSTSAVGSRTNTDCSNSPTLASNRGTGDVAVLDVLRDNAETAGFVAHDADARAGGTADGNQTDGTAGERADRSGGADAEGGANGRA